MQTNTTGNQSHEPYQTYAYQMCARKKALKSTTHKEPSIRARTHTHILAHTHTHAHLHPSSTSHTCDSCKKHACASATGGVGRVAAAARLAHMQIIHWQTNRTYGFLGFCIISDECDEMITANPARTSSVFRVSEHLVGVLFLYDRILQITYYHLFVVVRVSVTVTDTHSPSTLLV